MSYAELLLVNIRSRLAAARERRLRSKNYQVRSFFTHETWSCYQPRLHHLGCVSKHKGIWWQLSQTYILELPSNSCSWRWQLVLPMYAARYNKGLVAQVDDTYSTVFVPHAGPRGASVRRCANFARGIHSESQSTLSQVQYYDSGLDSFQKVQPFAGGISRAQHTNTRHMLYLFIARGSKTVPFDVIVIVFEKVPR